MIDKLRDKIAIAAMQAIIAKLPMHGYDVQSDVGQVDVDLCEARRIQSAIARGAYSYADAMLLERNK